MGIYVHQKDGQYEKIDPADSGKFLAYLFAGFRSPPFRFDVTESGAQSKNIISRPRIHPSGVANKDIAVHLNFFCTAKITAYKERDVGKAKPIRVPQGIELSITKLHITARTKADQDAISRSGDSSKALALRSVHRAANAWGRAENLQALANELGGTTTPLGLVALLDGLGYDDAGYKRIFNELESSLKDQMYWRLADPEAEVSVSGDRSATF